MDAYKRPQTLAEAADRLASGAHIPFVIKEFMDEWRKQPSVEKLECEPVLVNAITDAFLGGVAEHLSQEMDEMPPDWAWQPCRFLTRPMFWGKTRSLREILLLETPSAFRRRLIFCGRIFGRHKTEIK